VRKQHVVTGESDQSASLARRDARFPTLSKISTQNVQDMFDILHFLLSSYTYLMRRFLAAQAGKIRIIARDKFVINLSQGSDPGL